MATYLPDSAPARMRRRDALLRSTAPGAAALAFAPRGGGVGKAWRGWGAGVGGAVALVAFAGSASAQDALPDRQALNPSQLAPLAAAPQGELFAGVEAGPCPFRDSDLKFSLQSVEVRSSGQDRLALSEAELSTAWANHLGQEISVSRICEIRDRLAALYLRRGILAAVTIPEQRINTGRLVLEVVEARVTSVTYSGDAGPAQAQVARYLDQLKGMAPFDLNLAQRYLLLASDIPGVQIRTTMRPAGERGAVALDIAVSHDPIDASLRAHNFGSRTVGRELGLARLDLNSLTPLGERTSLIAYVSGDLEEQRVIQLVEQVRLGGSGLTAEVSGSWAWTKPGEELTPLELEGESFSGVAKLAWPIVRHRRRNLNLSTGLEILDQKVEFGGGLATLTEDHLRVFFARLDGHWAPGALADHSAAMTGYLEVRHGTTALGASDYGDIEASRYLGVPDALVYRGELQVGARLTGPIVGTLTLSWQHTDDPLLSYEEFSVGNLTVGRGYDPSAASGDRAFATSVEFTTTPLASPWGMAWRPYAFFETAELTNLAPDAGRLELSSGGLGVRVQLTPRMDIDVGWARPFDSLYGPGGDRPASRLLISLSTTLF
jgi:hemolysin activation/secretion protein